MNSAGWSIPWDESQIVELPAPAPNTEVTS
jgi:hypothetical protein